MFFEPCICTVQKVKKKGGKVNPRTGHEGPEGEQMYSSTLPLTSALEVGGWLTPRPGRFTPGKDPVPIVKETGWAPGPFWTGAEKLAVSGILSLDRPSRSESLYRLSYPETPCNKTALPLQVVLTNRGIEIFRNCRTYLPQYKMLLG